MDITIEDLLSDIISTAHGLKVTLYDAEDHGLEKENIYRVHMAVVAAEKIEQLADEITEMVIHKKA